ncbi:hypothetical protein MKX03_027093 [Papaver bracteatum]|nr:hypothetical protein MKX03_027093 [Papaver bracteatum]
MLEEIDQNGNGFLHMKIARYEENEVIKFLSTLEDLASTTDTSSMPPKLGGIMRKMLEDFVEGILLSVRETLFIESLNQKARSKKKFSRSILFERVKLLDNHHTDDVFRGFRPPQHCWKCSSEGRERLLLLQHSLDWHSDDLDEESRQQALRESLLPNLLKDNGHYEVCLHLCKALASLRRYWEALRLLITELLSLEAQTSYTATKQTSGYDRARFIVQQHPCSFAAWNCYYKVISRLENRLAKHVKSRLENRLAKHAKFLHNMRCAHTECVPLTNIFRHQLTSISQHQAAEGEYLEAYKLMPDSSLINICVGTAVINLSIGFGLQNKHQCLAQGFAFSLAKKPWTLLDTAYNLHLIYKKSGALDLARQVQKDHCTL